MKRNVANAALNLLNHISFSDPVTIPRYRPPTHLNATTTDIIFSDIMIS